MYDIRFIISTTFPCTSVIITYVDITGQPPTHLPAQMPCLFFANWKSAPV